MSENLLTQAIALAGLGRLAKELGVSYQAIRKWEKAGRLPRTEWTGETDYASVIERLTEGKVTREALLDKRASGNGAGAAREARG
jgi:hypothetical protein